MNPDRKLDHRRPPITATQAEIDRIRARYELEPDETRRIIAAKDNPNAGTVQPFPRGRW